MIQERITKLRQTVLDEIASVEEIFERSLLPDQPNVFTWHGKLFWVDRVRRVVVPEPLISDVKDDAWVSKDTLPTEDAEATETLEVYAGEHQLENTGSILEMWARVVTGATSRGLWQIAGAKFINLAISQPKINPSFGPLFWLFLADDLGPGPLWDYDKNLFKRVAPMTYFLINYPQLTPPPEDVRRAQIDFLEGMFPGTTDASCKLLSDKEWAALCEEQLRLHQHLVDSQFFEPLLESIGSLDDPDARKWI